ncbi:MAG: hypothetical protein ABIY86_09770 [Rhodoferax sp.]
MRADFFFFALWPCFLALCAFLTLCFFILWCAVCFALFEEWVVCATGAKGFAACAIADTDTMPAISAARSLFIEISRKIGVFAVRHYPASKVGILSSL